MTAFRDALSQALQHMDLTQVQAAQLCGIDQSFLSRLLSGKTNPTSDTMRQLFVGLGRRDPAMAEAIAFAYLRDEAGAIGLNPLRAVIRSVDADDSADTVRVPPELRDAFDWIAQASHYPEVAALIRSHGELCKRHLATEADSAKLAESSAPGGVYPFSRDDERKAAEDPPQVQFATPLPADQLLAEEKERRRARRDSHSAS
jgi:transcriptional regulator with XRE-family HTH domain